MRYQLDEDKGDLLYEVENDNLILKIKPEVIASIGLRGLVVVAVVFII